MFTKKHFKKKLITLAVSGVLLTTPLLVQAQLGDQVLKFGMEHEDIKTLQEHLINLNYLDLDETTTYYGEKTRKAVVSFQRAQGLKADGIFGQDTFTALSKLVYYEPLVYTRLLRLGIRGEDVRSLQERLKALGYLNIDNCTDYFGSQTQTALRNFQKDQGLVVDGIAGPASIEAINKAFEKQGRKPRPLSASRGETNSSSIGINIVNTAKKYIGTPYRSAGASTAGFDCSGFTQYVYRQHGIHIPRTSLDQANVGTKVAKSQLQVGDLVIFSGTYRPGPSHTGIYIGNGKFIHSSSSGGSVMISDLNNGYYQKHFSYGRRVF